MAGIVDKWLSELLAAEGETAFLGYRPLPGADDPIPFNLWDMVIEPIRVADATSGNFLLQRFLAGPQELLEDTYRAVGAIPNFTDPGISPAEALPHFLSHLGFTEEAADVLDGLSEIDQRRLMAGAVSLWKRKGVVPGYEAIATFLSGRDWRIRDWFYYRWLVDNGIVGEALDGLDVWAIDEPGGDSKVEHLTEFRIVDQGGQTLNRTLLRRLLDLARPSNERIAIVYLLFLDRFFMDERSRWVDLPPAAVPATYAAEDYLMRLPAGARVQTDVEYQSAWTNYLAGFRLRYTEGPSKWRLTVFADAENNSYYIEVDPVAETASIGRIDGGVVQAPLGIGVVEDLDLNAWRTYRVETEVLGLQVRIALLVDGHPIVGVIDGDPHRTAGAVGVWCTLGSVDLNDCEVWEHGDDAFVAPELRLRPHYRAVDFPTIFDFSGEPAQVAVPQGTIGGEAPYSYALATNASGANLVGGVYTAGNPGAGVVATDVVRATDNRGNTADATIVVTGW